MRLESTRRKSGKRLKATVTAFVVVMVGLAAHLKTDLLEMATHADSEDWMPSDKEKALVLGAIRKSVEIANAEMAEGAR